MSLKAVVGLGNPGMRYANTRHNVGFHVVDVLAGRTPWEAAGTYRLAVTECEDVRLLLVKPTTYMNSSGEAIEALVSRFDLPCEAVLIVVDDVHLDVGRLRFRRRGTHGGHNGLRSIIEVMDSVAFPRLRIGVGQPPDPDDMIGHVLGDFSSEDQERVDSAIQRAAEGVVFWATSGIESAMNRFNA